MKLMKFAVAAAAIGMSVCMTGCMSMDEMLASDNSILRDIGERQAVSFATNVANPLEKRLEVVPKISDQNRLAEIVISKSAAAEVKAEARKRIDQTPALASIAINAPERQYQLDALKQINKSESSRIDASWIFAVQKPSSNAPKSLLKDLSDDGKAAFAASFNSKIDEAAAVGDEVERIRQKFGDRAASVKVNEFKTILNSLVKLAPCVEDEKTLEAILGRNDVAAVKGTEFDFATPLEDAYRRSVAARREREAKAEAERKAREAKQFLAALTDDERVTLLKNGSIVKGDKTVAIDEGNAAGDNGTAGFASDGNGYKITREDTIKGIKDQTLAEMMSKAEAERKAELEFKKKIDEHVKIIALLSLADMIKKVQAIEDEKLRDAVLEHVVQSLEGRKFRDSEYEQAREILANSPVRNQFELGIEKIIKKSDWNLELCNLLCDRAKAGRIFADAIKKDSFKISAWNRYGKYIDDPASLAELAVLFKDEDECSEILDKINDDQVLCGLVLKYEHEALRQGALKRIKDESVKENALAEIKAEEARQLEVLRKAATVARMDAEEFMNIVQSSSGAFDKLETVQTAVNIFKGRALLFEDIHIWNADVSSSGKGRKVLLGRKGSEAFSFDFAKPFEQPAKKFKDNTGSTTVFGIVMDDTDGNMKNFHLVGGVVKNEKDIDAIANIAKYYRMSKDKIKEMADPAVEWPAMKLAEALGMDYTPAEDRLNDPDYKAKVAAKAEAEKAEMEAMRESVTKIVPIAKRDAEDLKRMFPDYDKNLSFDNAVAARDIFSGRALLITDMEVFNEPGNDGNPSISRFGMSATNGTQFYVTFKKPFNAATKGFHSGYPRTKGVTVFAIVTDTDYGAKLLLEGGVIKDENDIDGILKIVSGYKMSAETIEEMSDPDVRPAKKLAKKLGMQFNPED